jgi:hypothetical protein
MTLSDEQRRALEMLADAGPRGNTLDMLITNGFPAELLTELVCDGLAMMQGETVRGGRTYDRDHPRDDHGRRPERNRGLKHILICLISFALRPSKFGCHQASRVTLTKACRCDNSSGDYRCRTCGGAFRNRDGTWPNNTNRVRENYGRRPASDRRLIEHRHVCRQAR